MHLRLSSLLTSYQIEIVKLWRLQTKPRRCKWLKIFRINNITYKNFSGKPKNVGSYRPMTHMISNKFWLGYNDHGEDATFWWGERAWILHFTRVGLLLSQLWEVELSHHKFSLFTRLESETLFERNKCRTTWINLY